MKSAHTKAREEALMTNINILHALMRPGEQLTHRAIAEICGGSWQNIWLIEQQALRKVRARLSKQLGLPAGEIHLQKVSEWI